MTLKRLKHHPCQMPELEDEFSMYEFTCDVCQSVWIWSPSTKHDGKRDSFTLFGRRETVCEPYVAYGFWFCRTRTEKWEEV